MGGRVSNFPQRLRQLRQRKGMSQRVLSELLGLSKNMVTRYENGKQAPSLTTIAAIAEFFGVSMDYLAGRTDRPQ